MRVCLGLSYKEMKKKKKESIWIMKWLLTKFIFAHNFSCISVVDNFKAYQYVASSDRRMV
jgi:hypothetical protein